MAFAGDVGFRVDLAAAPGALECTPAEACFSESACRVVVSVEPAKLDAVLARAASANVAAAAIGVGGGARLVAADAFDVASEDAHRAWRDAIPNLMRSATAATDG
jgi:phosphoribosylformylglycinamidine (FGAM) synthase-like enzyme